MVAINKTPLPSTPSKETCRDIKTVCRFIEIYCHGHHHDHKPVDLHLHHGNAIDILGQKLDLCPDCEKLATHALVKRCACPMQPKPLCKYCPNHCYHPKYRAIIRKVMKYSGIKLICRGRLDYLLHMFN